MANGGKRTGAGREKGGRNRKTLEQAAVLSEFNQRVMRHADPLFNAALTLAIGSIRVFRVDEEELENGKTKRIHTLVTDADEIKEVLDEGEGGPATVNGNFYFVNEVPPDFRAIEGMLNRALGKPKETVEHSGEIQTTATIILDFGNDSEPDNTQT